MSGEELRRESRKADRALGAFLDAIYVRDERFRGILDRSLELENELIRRRNR